MIHEYRLIPTTSAVYIIIRDQHPELKVFSVSTRLRSGYAMTEYGFEGVSIPLIRTVMRWDVSDTWDRIIGTTKCEHFLCIPTPEAK